MLTIILVACACASATASARQVITTDGNNNFPYTSGTTASWWFNVAPENPDGSGSNQYINSGYFVCFTLYDYPNWSDADQGTGYTTPVNGENSPGPGANGCTTAWYWSQTDTSPPKQEVYVKDPSALTVGHVYVGCAEGFAQLTEDGDTDWFPDPGQYWCDNGTQITGSNHPTGTVTLDSGKTYTNSTTLTAHITYSDPYTPPFTYTSSGRTVYGYNFDCLGKGSTCTPQAGSTDADPGCSAGEDGASSTNVFDCSIDLTKVSGLTLTDGSYYYCVIEDDDAFPDTSTSTATKTGNDLNASRSPTECSSVILDRTPPSVTIGADSTTITTGQTVHFTATASDSGSGLVSNYSWNYGDGSLKAIGSAGASAHKYTQAGTYTATVSRGDNAGNTGSASVTIHVNPPSYSLSVTKAGTGSGTVTSSPSGISCGSACSSSYASGTKVTLTAAPASGTTFTGWSGGGCSGSGTCVVTVSAATQVTATFTANPPGTHSLTVTDAGTGSGRVSSSDGKIDCGTTCSHSYSEARASP